MKSVANALQKFLNGKTDNCKLERWSLELQGRTIKVEHIPGYKNKAARNDNPLKDETHVNAINEVEESTCCPLCEIEPTDILAEKMVKNTKPQ